MFVIFAHTFMYQPFSFLHVVVLLVYLVVLVLLIRRWSFFRNSGIGPVFLVVIFLVKCAAAILYGVYHFQVIGITDTFYLFEDGLHIARHGESNLANYLELVFGKSGGAIPEHLHEALLPTWGLWGDTSSYTVVRFHALASVLSFGSYNVHAVFMAFLSLVGLTALYRFLMAHAGAKPKPTAAIVLGLPSVVFYGSGLHKEGLVIFCIGLVLWSYYRVLRKEWWALLPLVFCVLLMFMLRSFYLAALLPVLFAYGWLARFPRFALVKYTTVFLGFWAALFSAHMITDFNLAVELTEKQHEFSVLKSADSDIAVRQLDGTFLSVAAATPKALINVMTKPWPPEIGKMLQVPYALEQLFILLLVIVAVVFLKPTGQLVRPALLFLFFSLSAFTIIGLIVPNFGAISRYKAPALLCFAAGLAMLIDWNRLMKRIGIRSGFMT